MDSVLPCEVSKIDTDMGTNEYSGLTTCIRCEVSPPAPENYYCEPCAVAHGRLRGCLRCGTRERKNSRGEWVPVTLDGGWCERCIERQEAKEQERREWHDAMVKSLPPNLDGPTNPLQVLVLGAGCYGYIFVVCVVSVTLALIVMALR